MTSEQRQIARASLVLARDAAHGAISALDKADEFEALGPAAAAAVPDMCASACACVSNLIAATAAVAEMQAACQQEG